MAESRDLDPVVLYAFWFAQPCLCTMLPILFRWRGAVLSHKWADHLASRTTAALFYRHFNRCGNLSVGDSLTGNRLNGHLESNEALEKSTRKAIFCSCKADSWATVGRNQLYNNYKNGITSAFSTAWLYIHMTSAKITIFIYNPT